MTRDHRAGGRPTGQERSDRFGTPGPGTGIITGAGTTGTDTAITSTGSTGTAIAGTGTGITGTGRHSWGLVTRL